MKTGVTISGIGHAMLLLWGVVSFAAKPLDTPPPDAMPIDIISTADFSKLRAGKIDAPKAEQPKPVVEKVADAKPPTDPVDKVVDKPEIVSAFAPTPPSPDTKVPEPKQPKPEAKSEPKPEPKPKEPESTEKKPDPISDILKKEEPSKPEPKHEAEKKPEPKKIEAKKPEPKPQPKFNANRIAALLDKRDPQRQAALGDIINRTAALGTRTGNSETLSQSEIDAFRNKLRSCWNPPSGGLSAAEVNVPITIRLKPDRTLESQPLVEMTAHDAFTQAMIDSAVRAIIQCQPYAMFSPQRYQIWREIPLDFNPREMFGG